ncbi:uncharacterized protein [Procambarus clarkii]|uniref:uncharacterized protein isoform X2 n=1 Tax=Procambarus clarkii TaxID=6728 RepID=UPI001E6776EF|nr:melanopsin-like isoform X2 [Procambarus clarkii]
MSSLSLANMNDNSTAGGGNSTYIDYGVTAVATLSFFMVVSMVLALGGNVMVILTIARHRGMRTRTNLLLANLAVADILVAVLDMPIALVTIIHGDWIFSKNFCYFNAFTVGLGLMLSVHTLVGISIHKFISITRPFSRCMTPGKIVMIIVAAWTWTIIFNLTPTPIIGWTNSTYKKGASQCGPLPPKQKMQFVHAFINTMFNLVIPIIIMSYCYYRIFKEVKDHLNRMRDFADVSVRNSLIQQKQITETLCIVLSLFLLFWMPYIMYSLSLVFLGSENVPEILNPIAYLFGYMNSACNPIIYALRSQSFRRGFSEIICRSHRVPGRTQYDQVPASRNFGGMIVSFRKSLWRTHDKSDQKISRVKKKECQQLTNNCQQKMGTTRVEPKGQRSNMPHHPRDPEKNVGRDDISKEEEQATDCGPDSGNVKEHNNSDASRQFHCDPHTAEEGVASKLGEQTPANTALGSNASLDANNDALEETGGMAFANELDLPEVCLPLMQDSSMSNLFIINKSDMGCSREQHANVATPECLQFVETSCPSSSQPNITALQWPGLGIQCLDKNISKSHREILFTPAAIMTKHIKSASVGDITSTQFKKLQNNQFSPQVRPLQGSKVQKPQWPLVWQPSVDNLYGSPILSRKRIFHVRKTLAVSKCGDLTGQGKHLRVAALINNVKRSFSDLFNLEESNIQNVTAIEKFYTADADEKNVLNNETNIVES